MSEAARIEYHGVVVERREEEKRGALAFLRPCHIQHIE
jgi:hypothetical protein